ncbi:GNAT family N-acetyltransferase [Aeoliella sp. ICT_H6.2]|uniref:GNAT family N-acetyltransferase n=1 Tax=Aeoliella straminimaris TaxID=2954799 RepID=A0A9X2FJ30_9BACT|nr:GNAT family N-acetyltransferase [Aeoliella straminimaris]MCO6047766.1 GNAT family N-acetyltransferase [Aeoliella straminimaris]
MQVRTIQYDTSEYRQELELRNRLLRVPLGLDIYAEDLPAEREQLHYGLFDGELLVGCAIAILKSDQHAKIRQMAVDTGLQAQGLGRQLLTAAEDDLRQRGIQWLELAARIEAVGFYEKLGYQTVGDEFVEVGIPHRHMEKAL